MKLYADGSYFIVIIKKSPLRNGNSAINEMGVAYAFEQYVQVVSILAIKLANLYKGCHLPGLQHLSSLFLRMLIRRLKNILQ